MKATLTSEQAIEAVTSAPADENVRVYDEVAIGQVIHQGDLYLTRVADSHPRGKLLGTRQLAIGQGEGSHHRAEGEGVEVYEGAQYPDGFTVPPFVAQNSLLGPLVRALSRWMNTHPKHACHELPAGTYQTTFQADFSTRQRVAD